MICKLMESANHLCTLFTSLKHMDNLPEEPINTARETSSAKVNIVCYTLRDEQNKPAQLKSDRVLMQRETSHDRAHLVGGRALRREVYTD